MYDDEYFYCIQGAKPRAANSNALLTFAIKPTYPATGFGYLELGAAIYFGGGF